MIIPNKYENLKVNSLVVGSHIIALLKTGSFSLADIQHYLVSSKKIEIELSSLIDTLSFLFIAGIIEIDSNNYIRLYNDSEKIEDISS